MKYFKNEKINSGQITKITFRRILSKKSNQVNYKIEQ